MLMFVFFPKINLKMSGSSLDDKGAFAVLPEPLRVLAMQRIRRTHLDVGEYVLREGEVSGSIHFIVSGALCQFVAMEEGQEQIIELYCVGQWLLDQDSLVSRLPAKASIRAFSVCELWSLSLNDIHELVEHSTQFVSLAGIIYQTSDRVNWFDKSATPQEEYAYLVQNRSELIQIFPLKMIASYLKITPETLSRVRAAYKIC